MLHEIMCKPDKIAHQKLKVSETYETSENLNLNLTMLSKTVIFVSLRSPEVWWVISDPG